MDYRCAVVRLWDRKLIIEGVQIMLAPITVHNTPLRPIPSPKPRLLLVADSPEKLRMLKAEIPQADFQITSVGSLEELRAACRDYHDLAVFDVGTTDIKSMLSTFRSSAGHKTSMLLVESSRFNNDPNMTGVLPTYRAMPCNHAQIQTLVQLFGQGSTRSQADRPVLL